MGVRYRNKTLREKEKAFFIHYVNYQTGDNMYKRTGMRMWTDMWGGAGGGGEWKWKCTCRKVCGKFEVAKRKLFSELEFH